MPRAARRSRIGGPCHGEGPHHEAVLHADEGGDRGIHPREFQGDPAAEGRAVGELLRLRVGLPEETEFGEAVDDVTGEEFRCGPEVVHDRAYLGLEERAELHDVLLLVFAEQALVAIEVADQWREGGEFGGGLRVFFGEGHRGSIA
jgi:hypothetical protein